MVVLLEAPCSPAERDFRFGSARCRHALAGAVQKSVGKVPTGQSGNDRTGPKITIGTISRPA